MLMFFYLTVFSNIDIFFSAFFQLMKTILIVLVYNNNTGSELIFFYFYQIYFYKYLSCNVFLFQEF